MVVEAKYGAIMLHLASNEKQTVHVTIGGEEVSTCLPIEELVAMVRVMVAGAQS
jgi:hypothetical protein